MENDDAKCEALSKTIRSMHIRRVCLFGWLICALLLARAGQAQSLAWSSSLQDARASAIGQGKLILLLGGRPTCPNCNYMENVVCEAAGVRPVIDEIYVPWFANVDLDTDYQAYASGLGSYTLPLICMIDPKTTNAWLLRLTGPYAAGAFEGYLRQAALLYPPQPTNLVNQQVIDDIHYQVMGHIWIKAQPTGVFYRVSIGTNTGNPFVNATGTTDWMAPLAPYLVAGVSNQYTFQIYVKSSSGLTSRTNSLVFDYHPGGASLMPWICSLRVGCGVAHLTLTNLTAGATNRVERALDIGQTNNWSIVTNLVSTGSGGSISEPVNPFWRRAFYRVVSTP
jgi:hypothetical protein